MPLEQVTQGRLQVQLGPSTAKSGAMLASPSVQSPVQKLVSVALPGHSATGVNRSWNLVTPNGLASEQMMKVQASLAAAGASGVGPRLRSVELLHYWASADTVVAAIEDAVAEALRQAGIESQKGGSLSPKAPSAAAKPVARSPHAAALKSDGAAGGPVDDDSAPMEQPPALQLAADVPREDFTTPALSIAVDDTNARGSSSALSLSLSHSGNPADLSDTSPRRGHGKRNLTSHPKSPRAGGGLSQPSVFSPHTNLTAHYHIVDEVDAAHARGALSPRSVSPALQLNQDLGCTPQSPMDVVGGGTQPSSGELMRRSPSSLMETSQSSTTPRRTGAGDGDHNGVGRPSRSPSPAGSRTTDDSRPTSAVGLLPLRKASSGPGGAGPLDKPRFASYQDIPRFYFAEGKPQTQSTTLVGPHSNKHDNPHLTIFEGVAVPLGAQAQLLLAQQQMQGGAMPDLASLQPQGPKMSPMLPLAVMEDEDVVPFIQREFARLPAPPPKPQPQPQARGAKGAGSVLRRPTTSAAPTKQEQAYRQALTATMQRVCTQAFGLPRYLGQLVFRKLQSDADSTDDSPVTRPGTSSGSGANSALTQGSGVITVAQVKEFYEKHLRFKSIVRRMFEVLIATSKASSPPPVVLGLGGALGGVAPSAIPSSGLGSNSVPPQDQKRNFLIREDFSAYLDVLLEQHPGLGFLRQTQDFQGKYMETVIIRVFYDLDRFDKGRISWPEFENSKLPDAIRQVDATDDINTVLNYFSYEHFYVLYCRFWELDEDRDLLISQQDLQKYAPDGVMNPKIAERIFQGHGRKLTCKTRGKMNYEDFVWFCLSEEDKASQKSIRFWFRILDLDGDGILSGYELETFYAHTKKQLLQMTTEGISFSDVVCQVTDMLPFPIAQGIRLGDLLAAPQAAHVALNMILNVVKFLQFEQRDPFVAHHDRLLGGFERNDWDRFARQEYDRMAQEADGEG